MCEACEPLSAWRFYLLASTRGILDRKFGAQDSERPGVARAPKGAERKGMNMHGQASSLPANVATSYVAKHPGRNYAPSS